MDVRAFREPDTPALIALWQACELTRAWNDPAKDITRKLGVQPELFLVGEVAGRLMASAMVGYDGHRGWINYLAVHPDFRRQGHGEVLMQLAEQALLAMGCPKLNLQVRGNNVQALSFYRALGYPQDDVISLGKRLVADTPDGANPAELSLHARYGLRPVINACGTFTPLGVSRSPPDVGVAVAQALGEFFVMDELQLVAGQALAAWSGAQDGAVTHCVAAGITMSVAAAMAGEAPDAVAALPDSHGLPSRVVMPAGMAINYGHPIVTDIRLAGATPVLAGTELQCSLQALEQALAQEGVACLLLVSSRLVRGSFPDLASAVALAHRRGVPVIIDGAAQDMRLPELLASGADAVLASAHKYLAAPTAGVVVGTAPFVRAFRAQERGIGRAMKASKEAIVGVLAALELRQALDLPAWRAAQQHKVDGFIERVAAIAGLRAAAQPDAAGLPFARVCLQVDAATQAGWSAEALVRTLRGATPAVRVMEHAVAQGQLVLELVPLRQYELDEIIRQLTAARSAFDASLPRGPASDVTPA